MPKGHRFLLRPLALAIALLLAAAPGYAADVPASQDEWIATFTTSLIELGLLPGDAVPPQPTEMPFYDPHIIQSYDFTEYLAIWVGSDPDRNTIDYTLDLLLADAPDDLSLDALYTAFILAFCPDTVTTAEDALALLSALDQNSVPGDGATSAELAQDGYVYSWFRSHTDSEIPFTIQMQR